MSRQIVRDQAAGIRRPGATVRCVDDGENVVVILDKYTPPNSAGYTPATLDALAFLVPASFTDACPDPTGFYVRPTSIEVAGAKAAPRNTSLVMLLGQEWRKFSWSPKTFRWDPETDTLETHLATIDKRFHAGT